MSNSKHCDWVVTDRDFYENLPCMGRYDTVSLRHVISLSDHDINNRFLSTNTSLKLKSFTVIWPPGFDNYTSITVSIRGASGANILTFVFNRDGDGVVTLDQNSPSKFHQMKNSDRFVDNFTIRDKYSEKRVPSKLVIIANYEISPFPLGFGDLDLDRMDVNMITDIFNLRQNCHIWAVQKNAPSVIDYIMRNHKFMKNDDGTPAVRTESDILINILITACQYRNSDIFEGTLLKYGNMHNFYSSQLMRHVTDSCNPAIITCLYKFECLREFMKYLTYVPEPEPMLETKDEPKPKGRTKRKAKSKLMIEAETHPEPDVLPETQAETQPETQPETQAETQVETQVEVKADDETAPLLPLVPTHVADTEPEVKPDVEPEAKPEYVPTYRFVVYQDKRKLGIVKVLESGLISDEGLPNYNNIYEFKHKQGDRHINRQYLEEVM